MNWLNLNPFYQVIDDEDEHTITAGAVTTLIVNIERTNMADLINNDTSSKSINQVESLNSLEAANDELGTDEQNSLQAESG